MERWKIIVVVVGLYALGYVAQHLSGSTNTRRAHPHGAARCVQTQRQTTQLELCASQQELPIDVPIASDVTLVHVLTLRTRAIGTTQWRRIALPTIPWQTHDVRVESLSVSMRADETICIDVRVRGMHSDAVYVLEGHQARWGAWMRRISAGARTILVNARA